MKMLNKWLMVGVLAYAAVLAATAQADVLWSEPFDGTQLNTNWTEFAHGAGAGATQSVGQVVLDTGITASTAHAALSTTTDQSGSVSIHAGEPLYNINAHPVTVRFDIASITGTPDGSRNVFYFSIGDDADGNYMPKSPFLDDGIGFSVEQLDAGWRINYSALVGGVESFGLVADLNGLPSAITYTLDGTLATIELEGTTSTGGDSVLTQTLADLSANLSGYTMAFGAFNRGAVSQKTVVTLNKVTVSAVAPPPPKPDDGVYTVICPRMFNVDMSTTPWGWEERLDYLANMTNTVNWPTVREKTDSIKFYITPLWGATKDRPEYRQALATLVHEEDLEVTIEIGGSRSAGGIPVNGDQAGELAAVDNQGLLQHWLDVPGARLDYITTDHSMMWDIRDLSTNQLELVIPEQVDYFVAMKAWRPGLKFGFIESLGYFGIDGTNTITGQAKRYNKTSATVPDMDFDEFLGEFMAQATAAGVEIDHFDLDWGFAAHCRDTLGSGNSHLWRTVDEFDYGRLLAFERVCHKYGIKVGVIFNDTTRNEVYTDAGCITDEECDQESADRIMAYMQGYLAAGGNADRIIFQSWMDYPSQTGPETLTNSFLNVTKQQMDIFFQE